jgi:hypothetical protein
MEPFDYAELPPIVKLGNNLQEFSQLEELWKTKMLPPPLNSCKKENLLAQQGNFVFFDPRKQDRSKATILAWIQFPQSLSNNFMIEAVLPQ